MLITNLGFAAFLVLNGYTLAGSPNRDVDGKFLFPIDITQDDHDKFLVAYAQSEYTKFDAIIVNLKRMLPRY